MSMIKYRGAETVLQLLHVGMRNSDDYARDASPSHQAVMNKDE